MQIVKQHQFSLIHGQQQLLQQYIAGIAGQLMADILKGMLDRQQITGHFLSRLFGQQQNLLFQRLHQLGAVLQIACTRHPCLVITGG